MKKISLVCLLLTLIGCSSNDVKWTHPSLDGKNTQQDYLLEESTKKLCRDIAYSNSPVPDEPMYIPVSNTNEYQITGSVNSYGNINGVVKPKRSASSRFAEGFNSGSAIGTAVANIVMTNRRNSKFKECMANLGWTK